LLLLGGSQILNTPEIGCLKIGNAADLAIFDLKKLEYAGVMSDPASAIIMCGSGARTEYTIVNGKIVVEKGFLFNVNEGELFERANRITAELLSKVSKKTGINYYSKN